MRTGISNDIKSLTIRLYLQGKSRDEIAQSCGISTGAASNIILEWKDGLDNADADALRELTVSMNRQEINAIECAEGFRLLSILNKIGVTKEKVESFFNNVYGQCQQLGVESNKISYLIMFK